METYQERAHPVTVEAIIERDDRILVVANKGAEGLFWSLPGGGVNTGETIAEALRREVLEETGLLVSFVSYAFIHERYWRQDCGLFIGCVARVERWLFPVRMRMLWRLSSFQLLAYPLLLTCLL